MALALLATAGCRAQSPAPLTPETARRIAVLVRQHSGAPYNIDIKVVDRHASSKVPGFDEVSVQFLVPGRAPQNLPFLLSKDDKTLAQLNSFDLTHDPREMVSDEGRPSRGGNEKSPVRIVIFDDLECPFCARMYSQLFPAMMERYGDKVRIAFKDFPLSEEQHPWAMHAAVDANCLAAQSAPAYWELVDRTHATYEAVNASASANLTKDTADVLKVMGKRGGVEIDKLAQEIGKEKKLDQPKLNECLSKQDTAAVVASSQEGSKLGVTGVPAVFVNGERLDGAIPIAYVWKAIDEALVAQGITPPPPVPLPAAETQPAAAQ